jgi:hypothetical protein
MQLLEDLWPAFTGALYDHRIPLLVGTVVGVLVLLLAARRRGWFAAARRHRGRAAVLGVAALAVALPLGWYLASPIFLRTELYEPAPVTAVASAGPSAATAPPATPSHPTSSPPSASATPIATPMPTPAPTPFAPVVHASGEFHGSDDFHFGHGTASVIEIAPGRYHLRLDDFSVRNGPDLYVYLSPSAKGYARGALELGTLKATDGSFGYDLPEGADPAAFASAVIWCKQFSHLFATAPFEEG